MNQKNPGAAAVMSFFIPGLGQIYNGKIWVGLGFMFLVMPFSVLLMGVGVGFITTPLFWILGIYDAYKGAEKYNLQYHTN